MNKKLAFIAVAAVFSSAAFADGVKITGKMEAGYTWTKKTDGTTINGIGNGESEIDFVGSEDLGNGLKAIWQMNNNVDVSGKTGTTFASGDTWLGLSGGFGTVKLGHGVNAYGDGFYKAGFYNLGDYGPDKGVGGVIGKGDAGGQKGAIKYETPSFGHVNAAISYAAAEKAGSSNGNAWAVGANWIDVMYSVHFGYTRQDLVDGSQNDAGHVTDWVLAGKVTPVSGLTLGAENNHSTLSDNALTAISGVAVPANKGAQNSLGLYAEFKPERLALRASYTHTSNFKYDNNLKDDKYALGASYDLSKRTALLAEYNHAKVTGDANATQQLFVGMHTSF